MDEMQTGGRKPGGVFLTQGMRFGIPAGGLSIGMTDNGQIESYMVLHVGLDMTPFWLRIAVDRTTRCLASAFALAAVWPSGDNAAALPLLEEEFLYGMQALCAATFAIDAFYGSVSEWITVPSDTIQAWSRNRTSRPARIHQVLHRGFRLSQSKSKMARKVLGEMFGLRDKAVHPPAELSAPVTHPRLNIGMEWRFVAFRSENAISATKSVLTLIAHLLSRPSEANGDLVSFCHTLQPRFDQVLELWESQHGVLFDRAALASD